MVSFQNIKMKPLYFCFRLFFGDEKWNSELNKQNGVELFLEWYKKLKRCFIKVKMEPFNNAFLKDVLIFKVRKILLTNILELIKNDVKNAKGLEAWEDLQADFSLPTLITEPSFTPDRKIILEKLLNNLKESIQSGAVPISADLFDDYFLIFNLNVLSSTLTFKREFSEYLDAILRRMRPAFTAESPALEWFQPYSKIKLYELPEFLTWSKEKQQGREFLLFDIAEFILKKGHIPPHTKSIIKTFRLSELVDKNSRLKDIIKNANAVTPQGVGQLATLISSDLKDAFDNFSGIAFKVENIIKHRGNQNDLWKEMPGLLIFHWYFNTAEVAYSNTQFFNIEFFIRNFYKKENRLSEELRWSQVHFLKT